DEEFFTIDSEEVAAEYAFLGKYARADSPETVLCIQTAERRHEVRWPCFGSDPSQTPPVKRLEQVYAVDLRIRHLFCLHLAGGPEGVGPVRKGVNEQLRRYYRTVPPLTVRELGGVAPATDTSPERFWFWRGAPLAAQPEFWVQVDVPQNGEP